MRSDKDKCEPDDIVQKYDDDPYELSYDNWLYAVNAGLCHDTFEQYLQIGISYGPM